MSRCDVVLMLAQRLRRWPHIRPTLHQCLKFKARQMQDITVSICWISADVEEVGPTLNQYSTNSGICQTGVCLETRHV